MVAELNIEKMSIRAENIIEKYKGQKHNINDNKIKLLR